MKQKIKMSTKKLDWKINGEWISNHINVDSFSDIITVSIEKGLRIERITLSMEFAKEIGFLNFNALEKMLPK